LRSADRQDSAFLATASVLESGPSSMEGSPWASRRSDDEESVASLRSNISVTSRQSRGKKRKVTCTTPDVPDNLVNELRTVTDADIDAVMISQVNEIIRVASASSNLNGTYIKTLKMEAGALTAGIMENARRRTGIACSTGVQRLTEARPSKLEKENEVLRKELARMAVSAPRECSRCGVSASKSGYPPRNGQNDNNARLAALERRIEELGPSIIRAIEDRLRGGRPTPKAWPRQ
jgi:hypothetical protein